MKTLTEQRLWAGARLIRRIAVDRDGVQKKHGITEQQFSELVSDALKPALSIALYLSPAGVNSLVDRLKESTDEDLADLIEQTETPAHEDIPELVQELKVLTDKHVKKEALIKGIEDLESGEYAREQQCIERVGRVLVESDLGVAEYNTVDTGTEDMCTLTGAVRKADRKNYNVTGTIYDQWMVLGPKELGVILAPPGVGKTTSMVDVACGYAIRNSGAVVYFSEEISTEHILKKVVSRLTGVHKIDEAVLMNQFLCSIMGIPGDIIIESHDSGTSTVGFLKYRAEKLLRGRKPLAIIVDYVGLLKTGAKSRYDELSEAIVALRGQLGGYFGCPIWTGSQPQRNPSREMMKTVSLVGYKAPVLGMADVADCWAIPHVSDFLVSLNQTDEEKAEGKMRVHNAKARIPQEDGNKNLTITCGIDYATCRIL